ncbi:alkaline phosphatase [Bacillus sp. 1NLA3E]|nr:alkaline phosphatase [Bacillus sp. 1NLA3E]
MFYQRRSLLILLTVSALFFPKAGYAEPVVAKHKNVIMMVMDGTNSDVVTLARWYKGKPLALDEILVGGVHTHSLRSAITDSAAAGTALATGHKTIVNAIGMVPGSNRNGFAPVVNLSEAAKLAGMATGLVSTSEIQNATPASYSSHVTDRNNYHDIAEQQVYQNLDVVLGGGKSSLAAKNRADREDLMPVVKKMGYQVVETKEQLAGVRGSKVWGSLAQSALSNHFDREALTPSQPSLADMTEAAIQVLDRKQDQGFFLFVEGSKIDWAAHKNDPVGMVSEVLGFDEAVGKALEYAKKDGNTMVIAVTDHGNSGLTMGSSSTDRTYGATPAPTFIEPLKKAKLTLEGAMTQLKPDHSNLLKVAELYGLGNVTRDELGNLKGAENLENAMAGMLASRAKLGFTTHGHTGENVFLYAYGPGKPSGLIDNTDIPRVIGNYLGITDLNYKVKYVEAGQYFKGKGFKVTIKDGMSANPVLIVEHEGVKLEYPENKNYYLKDGVPVETLAPTVFNGKEFFVAVE